MHRYNDDNDNNNDNDNDNDNENANNWNKCDPTNLFISRPTLLQD